MDYKHFSQLNQEKKLAIFDKIVKKALQQYDISVKDFKYIAEHSNVLYEVKTSDNEQYLLKIANPIDHSRDELSNGLKWLDSLLKHSYLDASKPITNLHHDLITEVIIPEIVYPYYCSLSTWINGSAIEMNSINSEYAFKWGRLLASIHELSKTIDFKEYPQLKEWNKVFYWDKQVIFNSNYNQFFPPSRKDIFQQAMDTVQKGFNHLYSSKQDKIVLHADLHPNNIHVFNRKLYALDFEDVMIGYPIQDISIALYYIRDKPDYPSLKKAFKRGYSSKLTFPINYEGEIELFFVGRILMFSNYIIKLENESKIEIESQIAKYENEILMFIQRKGIYKNLQFDFSQ